MKLPLFDGRMRVDDDALEHALHLGHHIGGAKIGRAELISVLAAAERIGDAFIMLDADMAVELVGELFGLRAVDRKKMAGVDEVLDDLAGMSRDLEDAMIPFQITIG